MKMFSIWFISLIIFCVSAEDTFDYNKNVVVYIVGQKIEDNAPKNMINGKYSVKPSLPKGLSLNSESGVISGIPSEEFKGECIVTFIDNQSSSKKTSVISISGIVIYILRLVWAKPSSIKCGIKKVRAASKINGKFQCKTDRLVSSYSIVNPLSGVSIDNDGLLTFKDYTKAGEEEVIIKAQNEAGDISYRISVYIEEEKVYLEGVYATLTCLSDFDCGEDPNNLEIKSYGSDGISELKDLLDTSRNQNIFDLIRNTLLPYCSQFEYEYDGYINVTKAEEYTFYYKLEGTGRLKIDDNIVLDLMDKCNLWSDDLDSFNSNSIELSEGLHKFNLKGYSPSHYYGGNEDYMAFRFWFKYSTDSDESKRSIPLYYIDQNFDPIYDLNIDSAVHYIPLGLDSSVQFTTPFIMSQYQCNTSTPLPEGLHIDVESNKIVGKPQKAQELTDYDLYCHNYYSETNHVTISIAVTDKFNKGVVGYYMKSSYEMNCYNEYDPLYSEIRTDFIRIDKSITHEYNANNTVWDGLTQNFMLKYGVKWEGYLRFESNITNVRLSSIDSSFLYIDNIYNTLIYHACHDDYASSETSVSFEKGLYSFALSYNKGSTSEGSGIKFEVKMSGSDEYVDGSDYLVYIPNGDFEYSYNTATYTTDGDILANIPILSNNDKVVKKYTVNPELPDGLELNPSSGSITGNPSTIQEKKEYTVSVEFDDGSKLSSVIYIKIDGDSTPKGLHIINYKTGEEMGSPITIYLGEECDLLAAPLNGYVDVIKFIKYPQQLVLPSDNRLVSNEALNEVFENEEIIIEAILLNGDKMSQSFNISCKSKCDEGKELHVINKYYFSIGSFSLATEEGEIIFENEFNDKEYNPYITIGCLIPGKYVFTLHCENTWSDVTWSLMTDGKRVGDVHLEQGQIDGIFHISTIGVRPTLVYPESDYVISKFESLNIIPNIGNSIIEKCEMTPNFDGKFYIFDKCILTKYAFQPMPKTNYTITASNVFGSTTVTISITISDKSISEVCEEKGNLYLSFKMRVANYKTMKMSFYNSNGTSLLNLQPDQWSSDYDESRCVVQGQYKTTFSNPYPNMDWSTGYIQISLYDTPLGKYSLRKGESSKSSTRNLFYSIDYFTEWSYSYQFVEGWNLNNVQDTWQKSKLSELSIEDNKNTIYLRYLKQFGDIRNYASFYVRISHLSGIIFYINGKELYRQNVGDGELNEDSKAISKFDSLTDIKFVLPIDVLNQTITSISMELHRYDGEASFPEIKLVGLELEGNEEYGCEELNLYGEEVTDFSDYVVDHKIAAYGFDLIPNTYWAFYKASYATMNFQKNTHIYFNQLEIEGYELEGFSQVKEVVLKGKERSSSTFKELSKFSNIEISNKTGSVIFPNYELVSMYESVQIDITKPENENTAVRDFIFNLCPIRYCSEIIEYNIPKTYSGTTLNVSCLEPVNEYKILFCENGRNPQWQELVNNCIENPKVMDKRDFEFEAGSSYSEIALFTVSGPSIKYSMLEEIKGLKLNSESGRISGTPLEVVNAKPFYFKAVNNFDPIGITFDVKLSVIEATKPVFLSVNDSITITAGDEIKEMKLFIVLGRELEFTILNMPNGLIFNKEKKVINGIAVKDGVYNTTFRASNVNNTESVVIIITVLYPNKPLISKIQENIDMFYYENYSGIIPVQCIGRDLKYSSTSKLPDGLSLIESSGELKGIVTSPISSVFKINIVCTNGNGTANGDSTIRIKESNYPILVSYNKIVTIKGGIKDNYVVCNVSGTDVTYSLTTSVPDYLTFDKKSGMISGYVLKKYGDLLYTMIVSGGGKSIHFDFVLSFIIEDKPVVVDDTIVKNKKFEGGSEIVGFKLFEVVGTNIQITVKPPLPRGVYLNKNSAMIYGIASEIKPPQDYVFTVKNPPSPDEVNVIIHLEFETVHCEADSGFPDTIAIPGGKSVIIKCSGGKSGYKSRSCYLTDTRPVWSSISDDCTSNAGTIAAIVVGVIAALIVIGCIVLFCVLRSGVFRKRAVSSVGGRGSRTESMVEKANEKAVRI